MKRILFVLLAILFFSACQNIVRTHSSINPDINTGTDINNGDEGTPSTDPFTKLDDLQCADNEEDVNGQCVCVSGYTLDDQGVCMPQIVLNEPAINFNVHMVNPENIWYLYFDAVTDVNNIEIDSIYNPQIRFAHVNLPDSIKSDVSLAGTYCLTYASEVMNCGNGSLYLPPEVDIPNGDYCLKAISCANGYMQSETMIYQVHISNSFLEGPWE